MVLETVKRRDSPVPSIARDSQKINSPSILIQNIKNIYIKDIKYITYIEKRKKSRYLPYSWHQIYNMVLRDVFAREQCNQNVIT